VIPAVGILINTSLVVARLLEPSSGLRAPAIAASIAAVATILYFIIRPTNITEDSLAALEHEA
jgi:hypothetical protein